MLLGPFLIPALWANPMYSLAESKFPAGSNTKDHEFFGSKGIWECRLDQWELRHCWRK
jgi:hypothetical protein